MNSSNSVNKSFCGGCDAAKKLIHCFIDASFTVLAYEKKCFWATVHHLTM